MAGSPDNMFSFSGGNLKEMSMKSTLPVSEWYGMRPPPEIRIVGFRDRYSKTRAPELIPLTICSKYNTLTHLIHNNHFTLMFCSSLTCPNRMEMLAKDLSKKKVH